MCSNSEIRKIRGVDTENEIGAERRESSSERVPFEQVTWTFAFEFHEIPSYFILFCIGLPHFSSDFSSLCVSLCYPISQSKSVSKHLKSVNVLRRIGDWYANVCQKSWVLVVQPLRQPLRLQFELPKDASMFRASRVRLSTIFSDNK